MFVDFHVHSTASDGTETPESIINKSLEIGLDILSITDHDNADGSRSVLGQIPKELYFITGLEISAEFDKTLHILGYNFDIENKKLNNSLNELQEYRLNRNKKMIINMKKSNFDISLGELLEISGGKQIGRPHFAKLLLNKGYVSSFQEAFDKYLKKGSPFYLDKKRLSPREAIELIKDAGGIAVIAHPYSTGLEGTDLEQLIDKLKSYGLDGIEGFYSLHTKKMTEECLSYAKKYDLLITSGSDFHGNNKSEINLGMNTPFVYLEKFLKRLK